MQEELITLSLPRSGLRDLIEMLDEQAEFLEITAVYYLEGGDDEDADFVAYAEALPYGFHDWMESTIADVTNGPEAMRIAQRLRAAQERLVCAVGG
jgi:hypothetical protein